MQISSSADAHQRISGKKLTEMRNHVAEYRGNPAYIRCDNGPEFIGPKMGVYDPDRVGGNCISLTTKVEPRWG